MKKIVILGCENSHADAFLDFIATEPEFSHMEVIGIYSEEADAAQRLHETFGVPVMASYDEGVGRMDGVIITARHGDRHYEYAKPYLDSGVPLFLDKPITVREDYAVELMRILKEKQIPVSGGSSLRNNFVVREARRAAIEGVGGPTVGGTVRAPLHPTSPYAGFFFYAQHLVEMVMEIFGRWPKAVRCYTDRNSNRTVVFHYEDFNVTGLYTAAGGEYYAARFSPNGTQGGYVPMSLDRESSMAELREYAGLLGGGKMRTSYEEMFAPVFVMNAIERANRSGEAEEIRYGEVTP